MGGYTVQKSSIPSDNLIIPKNTKEPLFGKVDLERGDVRDISKMPVSSFDKNI